MRTLTQVYFMSTSHHRNLRILKTQIAEQNANINNKVEGGEKLPATFLG